MGSPSEVELRDFFVSYTAADRSWAEWISFVLEDSGYTVHLQSWDFLAGGNFVLDMDRATRGSKRTIAVLSSAYFQSGFTQPEWAAAFKTDPDGSSRNLIPIRIENFSPEGLFGSIHYIDLVGLSEEKARQVLLGAIGATVEGRRSKPKLSPPFPGANPENHAPYFPGQLPPVWNLPLQLRNFTGRADLLTTVRNKVESDRTCAIFGLGGVGKSRLALEFAYRHLDQYDVVWRIRARDNATARADLADLATALQIAGAEDPRDKRIEALQMELAKRERWLLIFDDAAAPESLLPLIPPGLSGHVLVTSRTSTGWKLIGASLEVGSFSRPESVSFLQGRLDGASEPDIGEICGILGDLPLALEQAAGYMEATGVDPATYRSRLEKRSPGLLSRQQPVDYEHSVSTTWQVSMEQIQEHSQASRLLSLCAYLGADLIPRGLFDDSDSAFSLKSAFDPAEVDTGFAELRHFSLVSLAPGRVSIHPLVQWVVRSSLGPAEKKEVISTLASLLSQAWSDSGGDPSSWPACAVLAPHLQAFADVLGMEEEDNRWLIGELLLRLGIYTRHRGDLSTASRLLEEAAEAGSAENARERLRVQALSERGIVLSYLGKHEEAVACQESAVSRAEELGESGIPMANTYSLAGISFCEANDYERAREVIERGLEIYRQEPEPDLHRIGSSVGNLGNVIHLLGDIEESRNLQIESLEILEKAHGPDHHDVAIALAALAQVEQSQGDTAAALEALHRSRKIFEVTHGPDSLEIGRVFHQLAAIEWSEKRLEEARDNYLRSIKNYRNTVGPGFPALINALKAYAVVSTQLGDDGAAAEALREIEESAGA